MYICAPAHVPVHVWHVYVRVCAQASLCVRACMGASVHAHVFVCIHASACVFIVIQSTSVEDNWQKW